MPSSATQLKVLRATRDVAFWPIATKFLLRPDVSFRRKAELGRAAERAASVENDPYRKSGRLVRTYMLAKGL